ncbi:MAG: peroxiredoxin family protein [Terriglobia bacterium]
MVTLSTGTAAPHFTLKDLEGRNHALADALKQGPVLLAFFKASCPCCQFTLPFLERLHQARDGNQNVRVWGISQSNASETRGFTKEYGTSFPMLLDEKGYPVSNQYGLATVPTLFLVRPDGSINVSSIGFVKKDIEAAAAEFAQATGQTITVFQPADNVPEAKPG